MSNKGSCFDAGNPPMLAAQNHHPTSASYGQQPSPCYTQTPSDPHGELLSSQQPPHLGQPLLTNAQQLPPPCQQSPPHHQQPESHCQQSQRISDSSPSIPDSLSNFNRSTDTSSPRPHQQSPTQPENNRLSESSAITDSLPEIMSNKGSCFDAGNPVMLAAQNHHPTSASYRQQPSPCYTQTPSDHHGELLSSQHPPHLGQPLLTNAQQLPPPCQQSPVHHPITSNQSHTASNHRQR